MVYFVSIHRCLLSNIFVVYPALCFQELVHAVSQSKLTGMSRDIGINIYCNFWTKFSFYYRQPSKALKFSRQSSKLDKLTVNRQSYHPTETLQNQYLIPSQPSNVKCPAVSGSQLQKGPRKGKQDARHYYIGAWNRLRNGVIIGLLSYFKAMNAGPTPRIEPATSSRSQSSAPPTERRTSLFLFQSQYQSYNFYNYKRDYRAYPFLPTCTIHIHCRMLDNSSPCSWAPLCRLWQDLVGILVGEVLVLDGKYSH